MGADTFTTYAPGADPKTAFTKATDEAAYEHGHGGYTGTIAEKGSYTVIAQTPVPQAEAYAMAARLIEADDPRIEDKWGPAGAIPVFADTREETLDGFTYDPKVDDLPVLAARLLGGKVRKGEAIKEVRLTSYNTPPSYGHLGYGTPRTDCTAVVTIAKPPTTRQVTVTVQVPAKPYDDRAAFDAAVQAAVKTKPGERVVSAAATKITPGKPKVTATATKGATETRYVILGAAGHHSTWENGFKSQAEARAKAVELANHTNDFWGADDRSYDIAAVTRRTTGEPLVQVTRKITAYTIEATATISLPRPPATTGNPDGWVFFGWASS